MIFLQRFLQDVEQNFSTKKRTLDDDETSFNVNIKVETSCMICYKNYDFFSFCTVSVSTLVVF